MGDGLVAGATDAVVARGLAVVTTTVVVKATVVVVVGLLVGATGRPTESYNRNLWIDHPFEGAAYLPR